MSGGTEAPDWACRTDAEDQGTGTGNSPRTSEPSSGRMLRPLQNPGHTRASQAVYSGKRYHGARGRGCERVNKRKEMKWVMREQQSKHCTAKRKAFATSDDSIGFAVQRLHYIYRNENAKNETCNATSTFDSTLEARALTREQNAEEVRKTCMVT